MMYNRNFLWGVFVAIIAILLSNNAALAGFSDTGAISENIQTSLATTVYSDGTDGTTVTICLPGQYVYQCGNYRTGLYWLKSATMPKLDTTQDPPVRTSSVTKDYYVGDTTSDLLEQMRNFFDKQNRHAILYRDNNSFESTNEYQDERELILNNLCHPAKTTPECRTCPNDANVAASSVVLDNDNLTIRGSWDFHTIADCYMQEFTDTTGTYFFVSDDVTDLSMAGLDNDTTFAKCYYNDTTMNNLGNLNGDAIGTFTPGLVTGQISVVQSTVYLAPTSSNSSGSTIH